MKAFTLFLFFLLACQVCLGKEFTGGRPVPVTGRRVLKPSFPEFRPQPSSGRRVLKPDFAIPRPQPAGGRRVLKPAFPRPQPASGRRVLKQAFAVPRPQPAGGRRVLKQAFAVPRPQPAGGRRNLAAPIVPRDRPQGRRNLEAMPVPIRNRLDGRRNLEAMPVPRMNSLDGRRNLAAPIVPRDRPQGRRNLEAMPVPRMNSLDGRRNLGRKKRPRRKYRVELSEDEEASLSDSEEDSNEAEVSASFDIEDWMADENKDFIHDGCFNAWWRWRGEKKAAKKQCKNRYNGSSRRACKKTVNAWFKARKPNAASEASVADDDSEEEVANATGDVSKYIKKWMKDNFTKYLNDAETRFLTNARWRLEKKATKKHCKSKYSARSNGRKRCQAVKKAWFKVRKP